MWTCTKKTKKSKSNYMKTKWKEITRQGMSKRGQHCDDV